MEPLGIDTRESSSLPLDIIKFVRKVQSEWDENEGLFRPCEEYRKDEQWIIHWLRGEKFLELTQLDQTGLAWKYHLDNLTMVAGGGGTKVLVVLEGLGGLMGKVKNVRNRVHDNAVRRHLGVGGSGATGRGRKDEWLEGIDVDAVENISIEMQIIHEMRIVQPSSASDSAEWIPILA